MRTVYHYLHHNLLFLRFLAIKLTCPKTDAEIIKSPNTTPCPPSRAPSIAGQNSKTATPQQYIRRERIQSLGDSLEGGKELVYVDQDEWECLSAGIC